MSERGRKILDIRVKDDEIGTQRFVDLDPERADFLRTEGWNVASFGGHNDGGLTSHRGAVQSDEYIDLSVLRAAVEDALGYAYEDTSSVYRQGPLAPGQRQLRERIDSRMLALSRAGGNMAALAIALDLNEKTIDRALARARKVEVTPVIKRPSVRTRKVCFICEAEGARPRRRRHSTSPEQWVGTVDLCDPCYAKGFETHPGNPRYWEHRLATRPVGVA